MAPFESATQATIIRHAQERGAWVVREHQDGRRRKGIPDVILCYRGHFIAVEVKGIMGRVRPEQVIELSKIREAGGIGIIARHWDDVHDVLRAIDLGHPVVHDALPAVESVHIDDDEWGSV